MKIEDLIFSNISLGKSTSIGFYPVICPCCNDYKQRAGWKLSTGEAFYHCFNCGIKGGFKDGDPKLSKNFSNILKDFGISEHDITKFNGELFFDKSKDQKVITIETLQKTNTFTPEVKLPDGSLRLGSNNCPQDITDKINAYLKSRLLDITSYPFYYSLDPKFKDRVIIPYYRQNKIIYWQARSIVKANPRYLNCEVPKAPVLFNYDELYRNHSMPLFVCEGVFDAIHLNGIGLLGSSLNEQKIEVLKKTSRPLIFVIDKDLNGKKLGEKVIKEKLGSITFSPGEGDVNDELLRSGKIWTIYKLLNDKADDESRAKLKLNFIKDKNVRYR